MMEMKIVLAMLYKKFVFRIDRARGAGIITKITTQPESGLWLQVRPRKFDDNNN